MTYIRYALLGVVLLLAVTVALANRGAVTLALWPAGVSSILGFGVAVTLPLFVVVILTFGLGLLVGLGWEWLRERGIRAEAARLRRELATARQTAVPASARTAPRDEILALVEPPKSAGA